MTHPDTQERRQIVAAQRRELKSQPAIFVRCPCGDRVNLASAFRCRECHVVYCGDCALEHFGMVTRVKSIETV